MDQSKYSLDVVESIIRERENDIVRENYRENRERMGYIIYTPFMPSITTFNIDILPLSIE